jgi:hypothetical protein
MLSSHWSRSRSLTSLLFAAFVLGSSMGCRSGGAETPELPTGSQEYYTGRIYDGVTLERLSKYKLRLEYYDQVLTADVDASGRYVVGPLLPNADYSIIIEADGYRSFQSHNEQISGSDKALTSYYYEAFLYPKAVTAPAVHAKFVLRDSADRPSGSVRFSPRSASSLFDDPAETPAGVKRQIWENDDDLQHRTVVRSFADGALDLEDDALVLGVRYAVTVFGVEKYTMLDNQTFQAGVDTNPTFTLSPMTEQTLQVVDTSADDPALLADGLVEFHFNHDVALYPRTSESNLVRTLNDSFSISSPDKDADNKTNVLVTPTMAMSLAGSVAPDYRGVTFSIEGDRLSLHWDIERGLGTLDTDDPIYTIRYGGLSSVLLYTATVPSSPVVSLADLLGKDSIVVQVQPL